LVYCDAWICGDSPLAGRRFMDLLSSRGAVTVTTCACTVITSAEVARTDARRAVGGFNGSLRRGQDFDLWLRLAHLAHPSRINASLSCTGTSTR
jgi:hypothetical protein